MKSPTTTSNEHFNCLIKTIRKSVEKREKLIHAYEDYFIKGGDISNTHKNHRTNKKKEKKVAVSQILNESSKETSENELTISEQECASRFRQKKKPKLNTNLMSKRSDINSISRNNVIFHERPITQNLLYEDTKFCKDGSNKLEINSLDNNYRRKSKRDFLFSTLDMDKGTKKNSKGFNTRLANSQNNVPSLNLKTEQKHINLCIGRENLSSRGRDKRVAKTTRNQYSERANSNINDSEENCVLNNALNHEDFSFNLDENNINQNSKEIKLDPVNKINHLKQFKEKPEVQRIKFNDKYRLKITDDEPDLYQDISRNTFNRRSKQNLKMKHNFSHSYDILNATIDYQENFIPSIKSHRNEKNLKEKTPTEILTAMNATQEQQTSAFNKKDMRIKIGLRHKLLKSVYRNPKRQTFGFVDSIIDEDYYKTGELNKDIQTSYFGDKMIDSFIESKLQKNQDLYNHRNNNALLRIRRTPLTYR